MLPPDVDTDQDATAPPARPDRERGPKLVDPPSKKADAQQFDPYAPDDPKAEAMARALVEACIADAAHNPARLERDLQDIGNQRMYRGGAANQWICRLPNSQNQWSSIPYEGTEGLPSWVPRCTTNLFANKIDGVVSLLVQSDPAKTARPATSDDADIASANVADRVLPVLEEEIEWRRMKREISQLVALQDKVAVVVWYDNDPKYGTTELPIFQCADCAMDPTNETGGLYESFQVDEADGACPGCGGQNINEAMDPTGTGMPLPGLTYATGKLCGAVINSLGFSLPKASTSSSANQNPWVLLHDGEDVEALCRQFPKKAEAIRNVGGRGRKGSAQQSSAYAEELRTMSSPSSARTNAGNDGGAGPVVVYRLQHDPIDSDEAQFPEGLYAVMVGDVLLEHGPLPVTDSRTGQKRKSVLIRTYREMPGSPFGKPVGDDLFPLQMQFNKLESLAFMSAMHHAAPTTFLPNGVTLEDELTGQPGAVVRYRSHDGSQKPTNEQGSGVHPTVYELLDRTEAKMDLLSGLNGVLQGSRPEGGKATAFEVEQLRERGMASFRAVLDTAVDFERELSILMLDIARESVWVPRFQKVLGDNGRWEVEQFLGADLTGHIDIVIDPMSAWPTSPMLQDARTSRAVELGAIMPGDPEFSAKILDKLSLGDLKPSLNEDKKQIARELDRWRAATMPQEILPPNLAIIEPAIHLHHKKQFLKTEQAEQLAQANPPVFQAMVMHVQALQMALAPPPMADPNAPPSGDAVNAAVESGALVPEGPPAGPPASPLDGAIGAGVLQPEVPVQGPSIDQLMEAAVLTPAPPKEPAR